MVKLMRNTLLLAVFFGIFLGLGFMTPKQLNLPEVQQIEVVKLQDVINAKYKIYGMANAIGHVNANKSLFHEGSYMVDCAREVPIFLDHNYERPMLVGKVTRLFLNDVGDLMFEGWVHGKYIDDMTERKILDGILTGVSIGAIAHETTTHMKEIDFFGQTIEVPDWVEVHRAEIVELSIVTIPADMYAKIYTIEVMEE